MKVTVEMASSINGLIAYENGSEDFLLERNYQIMLDFLKKLNGKIFHVIHFLLS